MMNQYLNWEKLWSMNFRVVTLRLLEEKSDKIRDGLQ